MTTTMKREGENAPSITTADDLLKKLRFGTEEVHTIVMRGVEIPVRVLSQSEYNKIRKDAIQATVVEGGDETDKNIRIQKATLMLASTLRHGQAPMLSDKLLDKLSNDELSFLYEEYVAKVDSVNPKLEQMTDDEFKAIVEALKKNTISSRDLSLRQLRGICTAFQDVIQRAIPESQTGN